MSSKDFYPETLLGTSLKKGDLETAVLSDQEGQGRKIRVKDNFAKQVV